MAYTSHPYQPQQGLRPVDGVHAPHTTHCRGGIHTAPGTQQGLRPHRSIHRDAKCILHLPQQGLRHVDSVHSTHTTPRRGGIHTAPGTHNRDCDPTPSLHRARVQNVFCTLPQQGLRHVYGVHARHPHHVGAVYHTALGHTTGIATVLIIS